MGRHPSRVLVAALALSLLAACSTAKDTGAKPADDKGDNGKTSSAPTTNGPAAPGDPAANGANQIGIDQPDPSKAIFSKQFAIPGRPERKVTVGILSLERKDQLLILKVVVTPEFADKPAAETISLADALGIGTIFLPNLLDLKNLKEYQMPWSGRYLSYDDAVAVSGQPIYGWAAFAPPPAGVTSMDVTVAEWMPRFTNVPIR